jgi:transcriptional regulator with XRE-family HTH domain
MLLGKRIKELRQEKGLLQRQLAASLEIDTPMFSKIERGERKAKREQVIKLSQLLETDEIELLTLWLASQVVEIIKGEEIANEVLKAAGKVIMKQNTKKVQ